MSFLDGGGDARQRQFFEAVRDERGGRSVATPRPQY